MKSGIQLELCCADIHSVQLAELYKVDAVELCMDLLSGGLTPSSGAVKKARNLFSGELGVLIRPRKGNFVYDNLEQELMLEDVRMAIDEGADNIVFACLDPNDRLNRKFADQLIQVSNGMPLVFNRAIDICRQPELLIEDLIEIQVDRVLTSGRARVITDGVETIHRWMDDFGHPFQWVLCGKLNAANFSDLSHQVQLTRIHGALSAKSDVKDKYIPFDLGIPEVIDQQELKSLLEFMSRP